MVKLLLSGGAWPNVADEQGATPLCYAIKHHSNTDIPQILIDGGADPVFDRSGLLPLRPKPKLRPKLMPKLLPKHNASVHCRSFGLGPKLRFYTEASVLCRSKIGNLPLFPLFAGCTCMPTNENVWGKGDKMSTA